ncbi:MAG: ABC transporter ATP-binding protein [Opitutus sp.]|nr:ABC transporter ATP-binding protein [Opitutus sp.]MCS6248024.1 ABC transporter ATP-binding protein [Opitutus sp.]MCS6274427.1 ABC transporter ATP-binding protein [Opitutus sp.]MCS6278725.1 ABC transporter ATP-binding protein [Opitutus sp.]MCS6299697.1 ABC transporter ATP-binding protein [Opitutus sp.]
MSAETPAIEVRDLVKIYSGHPAVSKISFSVARGEILGFLGPNGAGKSTTMRILTGYLPATAGEVNVCGVPVASRGDEVKKLIGYMPENNPLPEDMRVAEYLHYRGRLKEISRRKLGPRIDEVLELCDLTRVRHRIIGKLSKGFRQRVGIADAILAEPPVIIMDEPTIGLDPHQILIVRDLIASLRGRMTVIISSHILPEIEMTCDRVLIINQGRVVAAGTPADLRREVFGQARYELVVAGELVTALPKALSDVDATLQIAESGAPDAAGFCKLMLTSTRDEDLGEAVLGALATDMRFRVRSLSRIQPTLEDVFLAATRRGWEKVDAPAALPTKTQKSTP